MDRWQGKVALVTGASAGIGLQICQDLLRHGLKVVAVARNINKMKKAFQKELIGIDLLIIKCDVSKEEEIKDVFKEIQQEFKRIDICINNAGFATNSPLLSGQTEDWRSMFEVNVLGLSICTREAVKLMQENNVEEGQIIHISSMSGHRVVSGATSFYTGTKFMVRALTEGLRQELRAIKSPIRVASISPGFVQTEFAYQLFPDDPSKADHMYNSNPCLQASDISAMVINILSAPKHVEINDILMRPTQQVN